MPRLKPIQTLPDEPLELPLLTGDGSFHVYRIQPVSAEAWFRFSALGQAFEDQVAGREVAAADQAAADEVMALGVVALHQATLGADIIAAMTADGVSAADIRRAHTTALVWHMTGGNLERAEAVWEAGETTPEPQESTSTTTAPATTTPLRKRGSSTTSPTKSSTDSAARSA